MAVNPEVLFKKYTEVKLGSSPTIICPAPYYTIIDSIAFLNITTRIINITGYILSEEDNVPISADRFYISINPKQDVEILTSGKTLSLNYGDILYAYSDFSGSSFNSFVICRHLLEMGA